ncbi:MAG: Nif3-like dinuclear metal center hexameric protein [Muribaculaceae bacterium]|nr:Nif3-like dinuclear metal center hexameric protein [Muribaculaceae bacterium]
MAAIEQYAPLSLQEGFDNSGIQVGDPDATVKGVLLCTDVREDIVDEAIERGDNLIISHHPLIFHPLKRIAGGSYIERIVAKAIKNDITIYAAHTNMDSARGGVNFKIAQKIGLANIKVLDPQSGCDPDSPTGLGVVGDIAPIQAHKLLDNVKAIFGTPTIRYSGNLDTIVTTVALCGGAGTFLINKAIEAGAQIYISADFKYHEFMGNETRIILADIGHYESEHFTKEIFCDIIMKKNPNFAVDFANKEKNQVKYL